MTIARSCNWLLLVILLYTLIERLLIFNSGALTFPDEQRYLVLINAVQAFLDGDLNFFADHLIVQSAARPGTFLVELPALIIHFLSTGGELNSAVLPQHLIIPLIYNIFISLLLVVSLYLLAKQLKLNQNS